MAKLALLAAVITMGFAGTASAVTYEPEPGFCQPTVVRDFLAPLDSLPELNEPPRGRLPFSKARVVLKQTPQLVVGGGRVGFELTRAAAPVLHPGWTVLSELTRVSRSGRKIAVVARGKRIVRRLGSGKPAGQRFAVGAKPALYRLRVEFRAADGDRLAAYGFYFRVVKAFRDSRLTLNATSYRPGQTVFARVDNYGTLRTAYGVQYTIERQTGDQWTLAPETPDEWILPVLASPPGRSGECNKFWIPAGMPAGHYRMSKEVDGVADASRAVTLTAEFDVLP